MTCQSYEDLINKYIEGLATFDEQRKLETHLKECPHCRSEVKELGRVVRILNSLEMEEPPPDLRASLHERLLELAPAKHRPPLSEKVKAIAALAYERFLTHRRLLVPGVVLLALAIILNTLPPDFTGYKSTEMATPASPAEAPYGETESGAELMRSFDAVAGGRGENNFKVHSIAEETFQEDTKIIRSANIFVYVEDFEEKVDYTLKLAHEQGGYVESSSISGLGENTPRTAHIALRVPAEALTSTLDSIENLGRLKYKNLSGENITEIYYDTDARVRNLQKQEERLIEILEMAKTVEEVLKIEAELNRVRTDIDQLTGQLRAWDKRVQFSLIQVDLREEEPSKEKLTSVSLGSLLDNARQGFIAAMNTVALLSTKLARIIGALVPALVLALLGLGIYRYRRSRKK